MNIVFARLVVVGRSAFFGLDDQDRALRSTHDRLRNAAQHDPLGTASSVSRHDNEIALCLFSGS
jgi:hypothetical protein